MLTKVNIDLWVLIAGVALPSTCLLVISLVYCWRRLFRRGANAGYGVARNEFSQQVLLEMVLQQTDNALNSIVDAVQAQRTQLLQVLETHQLPLPAPAPEPASGEGSAETESETTPKSAVPAVPGVSTAIEATANPSLSSFAIHGRTPRSEAQFDPYRQIPNLVHQGLSVAEVASRLCLPESAVDLYISLRMTDGKSGNQESA
jgi:hypothetical protein